MTQPAANERGTVAVIIAITLLAIVGFIALAVDISNRWRVANELQNAADAAALAGVRALNGNASQLPTAVLWAQQLAAKHKANGTVVTVPAPDVILGNWNFQSRTFTQQTVLMAARKVNAVKVTTRRTQAAGNPMGTFFAGVMGHKTMDVFTTAIGVGGSPLPCDAFPLAVPSCGIVNSDGSLRCNATLSFTSDLIDNVGFTLLSPSNPTTPTVTCMMGQTLHKLYGTACPKNCNCDDAVCNVNPPVDGQVKIANGDNFSKDSAKAINDTIAAGKQIFVNIPVLDAGSLTYPSCGQFKFNQTATVAGFVKVQITGASFPNPKAIYTKVDCTKNEDSTPDYDSFFGDPATKIYLVK